MRERKPGNYKQYFEEKDICFFLLNFVRMLHKDQLKTRPSAESGFFPFV
nr:hypothetical protein [uncultured Draconibacterium sp.]